MPWCVMEAPETYTLKKTNMIFHPEIYSNLRKYDKMKRKEKQP